MTNFSQYELNDIGSDKTKETLLCFHGMSRTTGIRKVFIRTQTAGIILIKD